MASAFFRSIFGSSFPREEPKFSKIKIPKGLTLSPKVSQSQNIAESMLLAGNFIEVKINQNLFLETNQRNGRIEFIQNSEKIVIQYHMIYGTKQK